MLGTLSMIYSASTLMGRFGRRGRFMVKAGIGVIGGLIAMMGVFLHSFAILITGAFLLGVFAAFGQYYRFAAIDAAQAPAERASAVAIVTGAGVSGGILGPFLGAQSAESIATAPYAGAFLMLALVCSTCGLPDFPVCRSRAGYSGHSVRSCRCACHQTGARFHESEPDLRNWLRSSDLDHERCPLDTSVRIQRPRVWNGASGPFRLDVPAVYLMPSLSIALACVG